MVGGVLLGFLVCEECGGYYELNEGESINDFKGCSCGGKFKYVESLNEVNSSLKKMTFCPECGTENKSDAKFCGTCGKILNESPDSSKIKPTKPLFCPYCGTENVMTSKTCKSCGKSLANIPKDSKLKGNSFSKYRNKRAYGLFGVGIIIIAFLIFFLAGIHLHILTII